MLSSQVLLNAQAIHALTKVDLRLRWSIHFLRMPAMMDSWRAGPELGEEQRSHVASSENVSTVLLLISDLDLLKYCMRD
jgi:hypothetical protein